MDEMEFTEAESNLNDLVSEYQQCPRWTNKNRFMDIYNLLNSVKLKRQQFLIYQFIKLIVMIHKRKLYKKGLPNISTITGVVLLFFHTGVVPLYTFQIGI